MINVPLLKQTLAHIEANPEDWYQRTWRCKSGMCFAGWAADLAGGEWYAGPEDTYAHELIAEPDEPNSFTLSHSGALVVHAEDRATRLLGLTDEQSATLFYEDNTLADLRRIVADLTKEAS
jgi:hypothetical protein